VSNQQCQDDDGLRWLALLIRQGLLLIVCGIEARYGLKRDRDKIAA
jgi:hypothetical protein